MATRSADLPDPPAAPDPVACSCCGTTVTDVPLTWTTSTERGRPLHYCPSCSREHLRSIEAKLDPAFW